MIRLKWVGPIYDSSGYGAATRPYICSLVERDDVEITVDSRSFEDVKTKHSQIAKFAHRINAPGDYDFQVTHFTPENFEAIKSPLPSVYNIAYTAWETTKLPPTWVDLCNGMDEIWVPSTWNKEVFAQCGVSKPITVIPHILELVDTEVDLVDMGINESAYVFYSIFQWIERKNPFALLRAYLTEFTGDEDICLVLKSYRINTSAAEQAIIKNDVRVAKQGLRMPNYPQVRFIGGLLSSAQMEGLHQAGDCFVLPSRAEGFGIPYAEAMLRGKPTIGTNYSGNLDFMNDKNSFLIDSRVSPVCNMIFGNYTGDMCWGDPDLMHLRRLMRAVYEDRKMAAKKADQAKVDMERDYNSKTIGDLMVRRLMEIK